MLNTEYLDQFKACVDIIETCSGTQGAHSGLTKVIIAKTPGVDMSTYHSVITSDQYKVSSKTTCELYLACILISGA